MRTSAGKEEPLLKDEIMGSSPSLEQVNDQNGTRVHGRCGVDTTARLVSRTRVIKLARALASLRWP